MHIAFPDWKYFSWLLFQKAELNDTLSGNEHKKRLNY